METLLLILLCIVGIVLIAVFLPCVVALPIGIVKALWLIVTGCDNDPEWVEMKEDKMRELAAKKETCKERRKRFWAPPSFWYFFK